MPKTATRSKKALAKDQKAEVKEKGSVKSGRPGLDLLFSAIAGAVFGLSAPGFDQWYLAWFCLAPFFLLSIGAENWKQATFRGLVFGTSYNLVYLNWYLHLHPLNWMSLSDWQSILLAAFCWIFASVHQGLMYGIFALVSRLLPLCGGALPRKVEDKWKVPALLVLPLLFQFAFEKLLNAHDLLGVPWSMIEYSQYKQLAFIQIASIVGGFGVGVILVAMNVALASFVATWTKKFAVKSLANSSKLSSVCALLAMALIASGSMIYGYQHMQSTKYHPDKNLSILQGNINIEMQKTHHRYSLNELMDHYGKMIKKCVPGFCIWTESALPTYLRESPNTISFLKEQARSHQLDMVVGSIDSDGARPFNGAFGVSSSGELFRDAYHKRYLVPVGEYTPDFVKCLPEVLQNLTSTPAGAGFAPGTKPGVMDFSGQKVAPLICFETIAPELVSSSVRNGGQLIANISDLAWFHGSMVGDQTTACAVFRAIENGRYFVYAANTGPSLVVNPQGFVEAKSNAEEEAVLSAKVELLSEPTIFTQWSF